MYPPTLEGSLAGVSSILTLLLWRSTRFFSFSALSLPLLMALRNRSLDITPVLHGLQGDRVLGVALPPGASLALLVRHNLTNLVNFGLALPVGHRLAILVEHLAAGPGRHSVTDSVVLDGALAVEILVALLLDVDGTLPLILVDSLLELPLDRWREWLQGWDDKWK